jgi:UDP-GlcNAc3NAcA epimerase
MKIMTIVGARPQLIKAAAVSKAILSLPGQPLNEVLIHTGQHFDANMSDVFFEELSLAPPAYSLGINGGTHGEMTGRMLAAIEEVLINDRPDAVLVYGDTNSTLAGALAAAKLHIPIAHVEAGLRSRNMKMPEEINRILTDRISNWLFTPTTLAEANLIAEGVDPGTIFPVGDVMFDIALDFGNAVSAEQLASEFGVQPQKYVLATVHRAENTDDLAKLHAICAAILDVSRQLPVIWPMHPRTRAKLEAEGLLHAIPAMLKIVPPLGYLQMACLEKFAALIATDSGGVQKEAFFHQVPCVTLREETEWTELVDAGWNILCPPANAADIFDCIMNNIGRKGTDIAPYGSGDAAQKIALQLQKDMVC